MFVVQRRTPVSSVRHAVIVGLHGQSYRESERAAVHKPEEECRGYLTGQWLVGEVSLVFLSAKGALGNGLSGIHAPFLAVGKALKNSHEQ